MRILVTGATGVLGRRVLPLLVGDGHHVTAVARSRPGQVRAAGAIPIDLDLFDPATVKNTVDGHDAVVDLATRIPPTNRMARRSAWRDNDRLRSEASAIIADAVLNTGAGRYVRESFFGVFADAGEGWVDEAAPLDPMPQARTALDAEAAAQRVTDGGATGVALRFGQFYGPDAMHTRDQVRMARRFGVAPFPGDPDGFLPALDLDDAATAVVAALHAPAGVYVVADQRPARRREHADALGAALGRGLRLPPRWVARLGPLAPMDRSIRLDSSRFSDATGWTPTATDVHAGWRRVVEELGDG